MKKHITLLSLLLAAVASAQPINFTDCFEGPTLDPFWTTTAMAGSITFPSTNQARCGIQSVQFNSQSGAGEKNIYLRHPLSQPYYGDVSVWVYDTGADLVSGNYLSLSVGAAAFLAFDYDLGPNNGGRYTYNLHGGASVHTAIDRTVGWHQFSAHSTESSLTLAIDGTTVYSGPGGTAGTVITEIVFGMSGPTWRPALTSYFDDFAANLVPVHPQLSIEVSQVRLCWDSRTNKQYQLQYRSSLTTNSWVNSGAPIAGNGTTNCVLEPVTEPRRFYRVLVLP